MTESFRALVTELVSACEGNQAEAARRMKVSPSYIHDILAGKGPEDPRTETWNKLRSALGRDSKPWMTREARGVYAVDTRFQGLVDFMASLPPERRESFYTLARGLGFSDEHPP